MITEKDFILTIKLYPELYNVYKSDGVQQESKTKANWEKFAQENSFKSGAAVETKWRKLVADYMLFLVYGTAFAYEQEMQFMQMPLLSALSVGSDDSQSESDVDEVTLKTVLACYDADDHDEATKPKRQCIDASADAAKSTTNQKQKIKVEKVNVVNETKIKQSFTATNQKSNKYLCADETNENLHILPDVNIEAVECVRVVPKSEPSTTSSNTFNAAQDTTSSGFTHLTPMELIFLGYAKVLQRMPLRQQLQTKRKIADIMDEAELQMLDEK